MILPRLGLYQMKRIKVINHIALVDGNEYKIVCVRKIVKNGTPMDPTEIESDCDSCRSKGWIYTMGNLNSLPVPKDAGGRYLSRT